MAEAGSAASLGAVAADWPAGLRAVVAARGMRVRKGAGELFFSPGDACRGFVVVLPEAFATADEAVWWRIDPVSGTTLGITGDGRGQALTAYAIVLMSVAAASTFVLAVRVSACTQAIGPRGLRSKEEYAALRWNCVLSGKWAAAAAAIETDVILRRRR